MSNTIPGFPKCYKRRPKKFITEKELLQQLEYKKRCTKRHQRFLTEKFQENYYLPNNRINDYITDDDFDLEFYSNYSYDNREETLLKRAAQLYNKYCLEYNNNSKENEFFYKKKFIIDNDTEKEIINDVKEILKKEFQEEYFDPYDYEQSDYLNEADYSDYWKEEYFSDNNIYDNNTNDNNTNNNFDW